MKRRGFSHVRKGLAHLSSIVKRTPDSSCASGGLYKSPSHGQTVDSATPLDISWDTTCLNTSLADVYLYFPGAAQPLIHVWQNVDYTQGSYNATLNAGWWNGTSPATLQIDIIQSGTEPFLSPYPAGPVFNATYSSSSGSAPTSSGSGSGITVVNNPNAKHGPTKGGIAAAVIFPLLIVGLLIAAYIKMTRTRAAEKSKRFSQAVDRRMSTISSDWKSISAAGASAAIRQSMAIGNRSSAFSFGAVRPSSTLAVESGQAGIGARALHSGEPTDSGVPQMSQLRPGVRTSAFGERVSRVSFAPDVRPSLESRRTVTSRAFHHAFVPGRMDPDELSPTQTEGPFSLTAEDIKARVSFHEDTARLSVEEVMPALNFMRTGGSNAIGDDYLLPAVQEEMPLPPTPVHNAPEPPVSPIGGLMPMQPASIMSPDEMLRAYATHRNNPNAGGISFPEPTLSPNGTGMRVLYSPGPISMPEPHPYQPSIAVTDHSEEL